MTGPTPTSSARCASPACPDARAVNRRTALQVAAACGAAVFLARDALAQVQPAPPSAAPSFSEAARRRLMPGDAAERERAQGERARLLEEAESQLRAGRGAAALATFERAALLLHAPDTELGIVRAHMATGEYRRALAFGAHTAGAHRRDMPSAAALYAWLLHLGGQTQQAVRALDQAMADAPLEPLLLLAREQLRAPWPRAEPALLAPPLRVAPYAADLPAGSRVTGSATLGAEGRTAVVPLASIEGAASIWLRNGLGHTRAARLHRRFETLGLAQLEFDDVLEPPAEWRSAAREPFAGSPGGMLEYPSAPDAQAAWPMLRLGFFAMRRTNQPQRDLGIEAPEGARGGPVFDRAGQLAGIALRDAGGRDRLVPVATLAALAAGLVPEAAAASPAIPGPLPLVAADEVFERGLRVALQVLVLRGDAG